MTDKTEPTPASVFQTKAEPYDWIEEQRAVYEQLHRLRRERLEREAAKKTEHPYVYQGLRR